MATVQEAKTLLDEATKDCRSAKALADKQGDYLAAKKRAQDSTESLNKLPANQKAPLTKELEQYKAQIDSATAKAEMEKKPDEAIAILQKVQKDVEQSKLKADLQSNLNSPAPNPKYIKLLLKESGGTKVLDDVVAGMDESTNRLALETALEARFGLDMQQYLSEDGIKIGTPPNEKKVHGTADKTAPDKSVKRVYEMLLKVPESHVKPKVTQIQRFQEDTGGAAYGGGKIYLNCGRAGATTSTNQGAQLCSPDFFPDGVDENCQPPADAKNKEVTYFDWATLHEVGHAVDDKNGFMKKNQKKDEYGGWEVYGADVSEPAKAAQKRFNYDLGYIKKRLLWNGKGAPPAAPAKPASADQAKWDDTKKKVDAWCDAVKGLRLWWEGELSKRVAIEGRVYQMSYDWPQWVSYKLDARKQGIHGYQFRAPGEWFAELYAAYYMGMLKPEHPAVKDWLPGKLK
jgi:hypothetical protein